MDSKPAQIVNLEYKKTIINKFVNSGINVTPEILDLILTFKEPLQKVNFIIKETSFLPNFNGHITQTILNEISDEEIKSVLKRRIIKDTIIKNQQDTSFSEELSPTLLKSFKDSHKANDITKVKKKKDIPKKVKAEITEETPPESIIPKKKKTKKQRKQKTTSKSLGATKSSFSFQPIAKDYNIELKILRDPTGKIYTNGSYNDFYELTLDKFNKLRNLMRKRETGDALSANNINSIYRLSNKVEVSVVGLVQDIRETKNGNYFLTLDDISGSIHVLLRKDAEDIDSIKIAQRTLEDQMLFVKGVYNPGEGGKKGIVYANYITKIDIPTNYEPNLSPDPVSIALLSDTHMGSKEFEEKLWNRFVKFLNGKIGNANLREIAGKVKYIIINGDLIDGIGIYPSQKEDLTHTDIYGQYKMAAELLSEIPDYIKIIYTSGNHEPVRNAIPRPAVPKKYSQALRDIGVKCVGNPCTIKTHNVNTLAFHGDSFLDMNMLVQGLENDDPVETMKELMICRHMAPIYGKRTQIAPTAIDHLVIDKIPDIFHTGHVHINGQGKYRNVTLVNSGCFQSQTDFMKSFGIIPTPGIVPIIELENLNLNSPLDLNKL